MKVNRTWHRTFRAIGRVIGKTYLCVSCEGVEHIPDQGACLVVSNHLSGLDPFLVGSRLNRPIFYVGKKELYKGPVISWFLSSLGGIPIDRGSFDVSAVRTILKLLREGELIGIAPEGTRSRTGEVLPFTHGATKLALHTRTPLVPVAIHGTQELMPPTAAFIRPGKVHIKFGELFDLSGSYGKPDTSELLEENTATIRLKVVELYEQIRVQA